MSSQLETFQTIGDEGGTEALALVATLMEFNAKDLANVTASIEAGLEADRDRWRARAERAERHIRAIERRMDWLLREPLDEPEGM